jgi:hypothetical protein
MDKQNVAHTYNRILASKRKEILTSAPSSMNLENIMPSEINQSQKDEY